MTSCCKNTNNTRNANLPKNGLEHCVETLTVRFNLGHFVDDWLKKLSSELWWPKSKRTVCWLFHNGVFTYVRTEVNYTEEVDDPVDSDGEHNHLCPACLIFFFFLNLCQSFGPHLVAIVFLQVRFWVLRTWCSASLSLSTRCWRTTSSRARWRKPCPSSSTTSSCTCRSQRSRWGATSSSWAQAGGGVCTGVGPDCPPYFPSD